MTTSKVFIIIAQVMMLCACGASNGGLGLDSSLAVFDDEASCSLAGSTVPTETRLAIESVCMRTNEARVSQGLMPLKLELTLTDVAQAHSQDMVDRAYFNHTNPDNQTPFDRLNTAGISYQYAAENIASGQTTPEQVVSAWMNSSGHRANILSTRFTRLGVGVSGTLWTQVFTD